MASTHWSVRREEKRNTVGNPFVLRTETLHSLEDTDLARVVGGATIRRPSAASR
jgi:hypothetical protein